MYKDMSDLFIQFVVFTFYPKHMGYYVFFQRCRLFLLSVHCIEEKKLVGLRILEYMLLKQLLEA